MGESAARKSSKKEMTSEELDQEFRELNTAQLQANDKLTVEQIIGTKDKVTALGRRMMRAEGENGESSRLPPVSEILSTKSKSPGVAENVKIMVEKKAKKTMSVPAPIIEEMELKGEEVEIDFEIEHRNECRAEVSQKMLNEVVRSMQGGQEGDGTEPVAELSTTFLQNLVSDKMDVDLGELYDLSVQQIVEDFELTEREGISRENRKVGDGKVSSESAEEVEKITIEDNVGEDDCMIRTMEGESWDQEDEEPAEAGEVLMPVMGLTPVKGLNRGGGDYCSHDLKLRPLIAPKKKWVEPERTDEADNVSSEDESCSTQRSATTEKSYKRQGTGGDCPIDVEVWTTPRRYE